MDNPVLCFAHACGPLGQYEKYNYSNHGIFGRAGGPPEKVDENLNPRIYPNRIISTSNILTDPEKNNSGAGNPNNHPQRLGIIDKFGNGYSHPNFNDEQAKSIRNLLQNVHESDDYHSILNHYTRNSYKLNNTLYDHHRNSTVPQDHIQANDDEDSRVNIHKLDNLIHSHQLPHDLTVYSGLHPYPNEYKGKLVKFGHYLSTSVSPHVAKDFGKEWNSFENGDNIIKNVLRIHLPKGHPHLFTDSASHFPGQGEIILPRDMKLQMGQKPTHIIKGKFLNHMTGKDANIHEVHIWTGRVL